MCVDDYQFRHQSALRDKQCRRFIFTNKDGNQRVFLVNISQFEIYGNLSLCAILIHLSRKGLNIKNNQFYLPQLQITIQAGDKCFVPFEALTFKDVFFMMQQIQEEQDMVDDPNTINLNEEELDPKSFVLNQKIGIDSYSKSLKQSISDSKTENDKSSVSSKMKSHEMDEESFHTDHSEHKQKNQEKTILQALTKIKAWRFLHQVGNLSLKNAAHFVELSKKTLDDYFLVIRVGEQLGYNFQQNLEQKIGHLRSFIRNNPVKVKGRLSKIVRSFCLIPEPNITELIPEYKIDKLDFIQEVR